MTIIRNLLLFCFTITLIGCSGLLKTSKKKSDKVIVMTTPKGVMVIDLYDKTPLHKANFIKLVDTNFYNDLLFHRVIKDFMVQGGDPKSKNAAPGISLGSGGPGYTIPAEFDTTFFHKKGVIAAARTGGPSNPEKRSSGSQFYLVQGKKYSLSQLKNLEKNKKRNNPNFKFTAKQIAAYTSVGGVPFLDGDYTVFGEVIYGIPVIDEIAKVQTTRDRPKNDVWMKVKAVERRDLKKLGITLEAIK